jgi:HEAT repeat protein
VAAAKGDTQYLIDALRDPMGRTWAAHYLGRRGVVEAVPALCRLLSAADPAARSAGALALGRLRAVEAFPDLMSLAEADPALGPRSHAIGAIGQIGDARAVPLLVRLLGSDEWRVRATAAWALGLCADQTAIPTIRAAARRERFFLRGVYRKAIRKIRSRSRAAS